MCRWSRPLVLVMLTLPSSALGQTLRSPEPYPAWSKRYPGAFPRTVLVEPGGDLTVLCWDSVLLLAPDGEAIDRIESPDAGLSGICRTSDGGHAVCGRRNLDSSPYCARFGSSWNPLWDWNIAYFDYWGGTMREVFELPGGDLGVVGEAVYSGSSVPGGAPLHLRVDSAGGVVQDMRSTCNCWVEDVAMRPDGSYFALNTHVSYYYTIPGEGDLVLELWDASGNLVAHTWPAPGLPGANRVSVTSDGGCLVTARHLLRFDSAGDLALQRDYQAGQPTSFGSSLFSAEETPDGGAIVAGAVLLDDVWYGRLLKLDSSYDVEWDRAYGDGQTPKSFTHAIPYAGGFVVIGTDSSASEPLWVLRLGENGKLPGCPPVPLSTVTVDLTDNEVALGLHEWPNPRPETAAGASFPQSVPADVDFCARPPRGTLSPVVPGSGGTPRERSEAGPRGVVVRGDDAVPGFTLLAPLRSTSTYLIDLAGEVAHAWQDDLYPGFSAYLLPDGRLLRTCRRRSPGFQGDPQGGLLRELDWEGRKTWEFGFDDGRFHLHHDVAPLPNGNVLVIAWELLSPEEAAALGRDPELVSDLGFWPCAVFEIEPTRPVGGEVVWEWHAREHLIQDRDETLPGYGNAADHPERIDVHADLRDPGGDGLALRRELAQLGYLGGSETEEPAALERRAGRAGRRRAAMADWLHVNAIDYLPEHDLIVLSSRHLSEVLVIDHSTTTEEAAGRTGGRWGHGGDLLYRFGNPENLGAGGAADQVFFGQHDARWHVAEGGALTLSVFNNGLARRWSSVDVIELPFDASRGFLRGPDGAFLPSRVRRSWSAAERESLFSPAISGAQPLEGGHVLVCSGTQGRVLEVDAAGEVVWELENDLGLPAPGPRASRGVRAAGLEVPAPPGMEGAGSREPSRPNVSALFRATRIPADDPRLARLQDDR